MGVLAKIKIMRDGGLKKITGEKKIGDEQFEREAALRIFSHNVRTIPAGSGFQDISHNFRRNPAEVAFRIFSHNFGTIPAGSGFQDIFP